MLDQPDTLRVLCHDGATVTPSSLSFPIFTLYLYIHPWGSRSIVGPGFSTYVGLA